MQYKIVADSSSNLHRFEGVPYAAAPLKIITREKEYVDDEQLDVAAMVEELEAYPGTSGSSCPNIQEWLDAFEGADHIFAIAITSGLSGAYSSAVNARREYLRMHPEAKVCVIDSLSTGPEMELIMEKIRSGIQQGLSFEQIETEAAEYMKHTHLLFMLRSMNNLARNGRVNPAVAKLASVLHICVVGRASAQGTLEQLHKCRGEKRAHAAILDEMTKEGFNGGRVSISHCLNESGAQQLRALILERFPNSRVTINATTALCSFYAARGGLLVGYEDEK